MAENLDYAIQYDVDGTMYVARPVDGNITFEEGTVDNPLATVSLSQAAWEETKNDTVPGMEDMLSPAKMTEARLEKLRNTNGKLNLELTKEDGEVVRSTTLFNNAETPEVTLMMKAEDFAQVLSGELNSQMAFMTGKLKFQGDMAFLMKLGTLM